MKYIYASLTLLAFIGISFVSANEPVRTAQPVEPMASPAATVAPHCEVPCGIYADQMRFEMMLEDTATIAKAITNVNEFARFGQRTICQIDQPNDTVDYDQRRSRD